MMDYGLNRIKPLALTTAQLPNGLRMVHIHEPSAASGIFGVMTLTGSRNDPADHPGLAHFVEHTIFKGTQKRSASRINNHMEAIGGELNAYTTKEETVVYTIFPGDNPRRGAELIADMVRNSTFPQRELDKERQVIADEIDSYTDTPSEEVFDRFDELLFANPSLRHRILGTPESLRNFTSEVCRAFIDTWYVPGNMCVFYSGALAPEATFRCIERFFGDMDGSTTAPHTSQAVHGGEQKILELDDRLHQTHTVMGALMPASIGSPSRFALALFTNIIGGPGMNSLLNVEMRERRGLVYNVEASTTLMSDCAMTTVYYGCDRDDAARCNRIATRVVQSVADGKINSRALDRAITQYIGQWIVASENRENTVLAAARSVLIGPGVTTREATIQHIRAVTPSDVAAMATHLLDNSYRITMS